VAAQLAASQEGLSSMSERVMSSIVLKSQIGLWVLRTDMLKRILIESGKLLERISKFQPKRV
jgi:hypothetical protein